MSMIQQLISAISNAERQIDDQMSKLRSYGAEIDQVTQRVEANLSGSQRDYGQRMLQQLSTTKKQVEQTIERLQTAKDKLIQVKMI